MFMADLDYICSSSHWLPLATQLFSQKFTRGKAVNLYYMGVVTKVGTLPILRYRHWLFILLKLFLTYVNFKWENIYNKLSIKFIP